MKLRELTGAVATTATMAGCAGGGAGEPEITALAYDSRLVRPGTLFFCVPGFQSDGHDFAAQAVASGAAALVVERPLSLGVAEIVVESARAAMAPIAACFYGDPSSELRVVGITGTNGKTTTAFLVRALLEAGGQQCGLLGTVKSVVGGVEHEVLRTTPEAIDLQADFRAMFDGGDRACAMEVSSHALELGRAEAIHFAAAIFTNLTRDHLDFHDTMEDYFQAKRRLFAAGPGVSVVNVGDPYGRRLAGEIEGGVTFAVDEPADYSAMRLRCDIAGCRFALRTPAGEREVALGLAGRFNVANALGAFAAAHALGGDHDTLVAALESPVRVPGRFERVDEGQDFAVLVDYAHTPDSLENVLRAARELVTGAAERTYRDDANRDGAGRDDAGRDDARCDDAGRDGERVVCVFGAGGDRDRGKRPLMGEVAARLADVVFVTSDNPRSEQPERIVAEIMRGAEQVARPERALPVRAVVDRGAAIAAAIAAARPGDVVVIAGKGHEQGQELAGGRKLPFDDVMVARQVLRSSGVRVSEGRPAGGVA
jgi:UDP-N-acetylmuramoyl-L-alanyl-D-glutamate--2,6-diaminopimelate ligase